MNAAHTHTSAQVWQQHLGWMLTNRFYLRQFRFYFLMQAVWLMEQVAPLCCKMSTHTDKFRMCPCVFLYQKIILLLMISASRPPGTRRLSRQLIQPQGDEQPASTLYKREALRKSEKDTNWSYQVLFNEKYKGRRRARIPGKAHCYLPNVSLHCLLV